MSAPIIRIDDPYHADSDLIIDVRSPSEYADDHIVGSVNKPSLSDDERAQVGTLYKQKSAFEARKIGAALTARNIAHHIETSFLDRSADFTPLIYCWRGGQRSRAVAKIFSEIGWTSYVLDGGYKQYRKQVMDSLDNLPSQFNFVIIASHTGSAKTKLLHILSERGAQIIDLEGLASHKGSVLGSGDTPQPSQKYFESLIAYELQHLDPAKPVFLESESAKIGNVHIPKLFWQQMISSPLVMIETPRSERARYLISEYQNLMSDTSLLSALISGMKQRHGIEKTAKWRGFLDDENWLALAEILLEEHYDPAYSHSVLRHGREVAMTLSQDNCSEDCLSKTAEIILKNSFDK